MPQVVGTERTLLIVKICFATIFLFFGAFGFFFFLYRNSYIVSALCLLTEIATATILQFNAKYLRNTLHAKYSAPLMSAVKFLSGLIALGGIIAGIVFIALGANQHHSFAYIRSYYLAAIAAFVSGFWTTILCLDCHKFERILLNPVISVIN